MAQMADENTTSKIVCPNELLIRFFQAACEMEHVFWNPPLIKTERTGSRSRHLQPILRSCYEASTTLRSLIDRKADLWQTVVDIPFVNGEALPDSDNIQNSVLDVYIDCDRVVDVHDRKVMIGSGETMDFVKRNAPRTRAIHLRGQRVSILEVAYEISQDISSFSQLLTFNFIYNNVNHDRFAYATCRVSPGNLLNLNAPRISSLSMGLRVDPVSYLASFPPVLVADITAFSGDAIIFPPQDLCLHLCRLSIDLYVDRSDKPDWSGLVFPRLTWLKMKSQSNVQYLKRLGQADFGMLKYLCMEERGSMYFEYGDFSSSERNDEKSYTSSLETFNMSGTPDVFQWMFSRCAFPALAVAQLTIQESDKTDRSNNSIYRQNRWEPKKASVISLPGMKRLEITSNFLVDVVYFFKCISLPSLTVLQFRSSSICPRLKLDNGEELPAPAFEGVHTLILDLHTLPFLRHIKSSILTHVVLHYGNKGTVWTIDVHMQDSESGMPAVFPNITELTLIFSGGIPWMEYLFRFFQNVQSMNVHLLGDASATSLVTGLIGVKETYVKTPKCLAPRLRQLRIRDAGRRPFSTGFLNAIKGYLHGRIEAPSATTVEVLHLAPEPRCDEAEINTVRTLVKDFQTFSIAAFPPDIEVTSKPTPNCQLPDDLHLIAKVLVETHAIASSEETQMDPGGGFWMLKVQSDIPSESGFLIQITGRCPNETTHVCYGSIQGDARDVMLEVASNRRCTLERSLDQEPGVIPSFRIRVDFSIDLNSQLQISAADQLHFPLDEKSIATFLNATIEGGSEVVKSTDLCVVYDSIQQLQHSNRNRSLLLNGLGDVHLENYSNTQCVDDLHKAVSAYSEAHRDATWSDPQMAMYLADLGAALQTRFDRLGDLNDINQSVSNFEEAVQLISDGQPNKPSHLSNLGISLLRRFERLGDLNDINQSVSRIEEAVQLTPDSHTIKPSRLKRLGNSFLARFELLRDVNDINQSVSKFEEAVELTPDGQPDKPSRLCNLGNSLLVRFERLGNLTDINQSVSKFEEALELTPDGDPDKPSRLHNLGNSLALRFDRLGDLGDINQSVSRIEEAVQLTPDSHPDKPAFLNNLGSSLLRRFERLGDLNDINQSVLRQGEALELTPDGHPNKPSRLNNLGNSLLRRFERLGDLNDINQSVSNLEEAVEITPAGHSDKPLYLINLGCSLLGRFERHRNLNDINKSVSMCEQVVRLTVDYHLDKPSRLNNLGNSLLGRFELLGDVNDINQSVSKLEEAVQLTSNGHPDKPSRLYNLGSSLLRRFERLGDLSDINHSVSKLEEAVEITPAGHSDKPSYLINLGSSLLRRFERLGDLSDINKSISKFEKAVELTSDSHPDKPSRLNNLGNSLFHRFLRLGNLDDINKSVSKLEEAVRLTPDGHPDKPARWCNLGNSLLGRFERLGDLNDIHRSVSKLEEALELTPDGHPDKPSRLNTLGNSLFRRFERLGDLNDINQSVSRKGEALELTPDGHPDKPPRLNNLGNSLLRRFQCLGDLTDINQSVSMFEEAVRLTPDAHPDKPSRLNNLGNSLLRRFQRLGDLTDINQSVSVFEEAVRLTVYDHLDKPSRLNNLGNSLFRRFERLGGLTDINQSVSRFEVALELTPDGYPDKPSWLNNLGNSLLARFERLGDLTDINQSVSKFEEALELTPDGDPDKPSWLNNLGNSLLARFERLGDLNDINQAVLREEEAVRLTPDGHPDKSSRLNNLGNSLLGRFERLGNLNDINQSVSKFEEAVQLTPESHPSKPVRLNNLGSSLFRRFERLGDLNDINQSVLREGEAVQLSPDNHPDKPLYLSNLGNSLSGRFKRLGNLNDINQSVSRLEEAVQLTPDSHPSKPSLLHSLGHSLLDRFKCLRDLNDIEHAIQSYSTAALSIAGPATVRFCAASIWARLNAQFAPSSIIDSYATALELLPYMAWQGLTMADRQYHLLKAGTVVRDAVSAAIGTEDFHKAVEWLDQGHSVIWGQLFNLRTSYDDLNMKHPSYAQRLTTLSKELEGSSTRYMVDVNANRVQETDTVAISQRYHVLAHEREDLLSSIRNLDGFDRFLLPKKFAQLQMAAKDRTVILINISKQRCDALILIPNHDNVIHIPLSNFDFHTAEELHTTLQNLLVAKGCRMSNFDINDSNRVPPQVRFGPQEPDLEQIFANWRSLQDDDRKLQPVSALNREHRLDPAAQFPWILKELWERAVKPILERLAFPEDKPDLEIPGIAWCLTGPLTFLPIHAAGIYEDKMGPKLSDYAISSYIPTLSNLLPRSQSMPAQKPQVLAVALPLESKLKHTDVEVSKITEAASGLVESITLMEENATADEVAKYMKKASFVHFACHGYQNLTDPTQSALLLAKKSQLTLERISRLHLPKAELAFLSACQTAAGDENLAQEAVHLAAGMLLAGYRGVVATMWSIQDSDAPIVADVFYRTVFNTSNPDATHAARALHKAVSKLKGEVGESSFLSWVPFIHIGV